MWRRASRECRGQILGNRPIAKTPDACCGCCGDASTMRYFGLSGGSFSMHRSIKEGGTMDCWGMPDIYGAGDAARR